MCPQSQLAKGSDEWRHRRQGVMTNLLLHSVVAYVCKVLFIKIIYVALELCGNRQDTVSKTT